MSNKEYAEYEIGEKVLVVAHNKTATIEDVLYSNKTDDWMYIVRFVDSPVAFSRPMLSNELQAVAPKSYSWEVFQADDNVIVAVMYEVCGDTKKEVSRCHGHIMHDGLIGVAQAASFAMKRIYIGMNDGKYIGSEDDGYVR